ncbi:MAG: hypothetical protein RR404_03945 [Bacilli bacterium]
MEVIIIVAILLAVIVFFKKFSNFVYAVAIIDIFLRILTFIKLNINVPEISNFIIKYFPTNIPAIINKYTNEMFSNILIWIYIVIFIIFEYYIIKSFIKKKL